MSQLLTTGGIINPHMPLVIICGYPASGKTILANKLKDLLVHEMEKGKVPYKKVQVVNEEFLKLSSNDYYMNASEEKKVRAALLAASERFITKDTVLILDSLNYIKGFRYQLYCQARAASTPHLVVHCETLEETCRAWNRKKERIYPDDQLEDLFLRFEAPNNQNKWDSPLISIISDGLCDSDLEATFKESILPVISTTPNRPPSTSTLTNKPVSSSSTSHSSNSIQILDQETQKIIDTIIRHQQDNLCLVKFPNTPKTLNLPRPVSQATLSRIRRQFLHMNRLHPTVDPEKIKNLFIDFMAANMYL